MIGLTAISLAMLASAQNAEANDYRTEFRSCLKESIGQAKTANVAADGFAAFANERCGKSAAGLKAALVSFDVKNKVARKQAESDAQSQIDEFVATANDRYSASVAPN